MDAKRLRSAFLPLFVTAFLGQLSSTGRAAPDPKPSPPSPPSQTRALALSGEEREWLTSYVAPIIGTPEKSLFLRLTTHPDRERFEEEFWRIREDSGMPWPMGPGFRQRYAVLRRLADETYDGWKHDAGRMVIANGEPDELEGSSACRRSMPSAKSVDDFEFEVWTYAGGLRGRSGPRRFLFYRASHSAHRRLWTTSALKGDRFAPSARSLEALGSDCGFSATGNTEASATCRCRLFEVYQETVAREGNWTGGESEAAEIESPPRIPQESLRRLEREFQDLGEPLKDDSSVMKSLGGASDTPASGHRKLSAEERKAFEETLTPKYRHFLELARPLVRQEEIDDFLQLKDEDKDAFMETFWKTHS